MDTTGFIQIVFVTIGCAALAGVVITRDDGPKWGHFQTGLFHWLRNDCPSWFIRKITSCARCAPLWLGALPAYILLMMIPQSIYILLPLACVGYAYAIEGMAGVS